ncbi:nuclear transport factor 2 family protein [Vibrio sp. PID23_8]|jgi:limonene-1,2-epoxide hydrolase|uniref:nuclear transport factor 2 family protein n=1 Tax=Vibrio sp. PID23_8 TaxID=1583767 RepID=UPI000E684B77|nr:nuclear transport factor 2 family protein [Vibrio sp. PID23_8]RIZ53275.1 polyketide cyclase [Vibrio sp. PID23_8]
MTEKTIVLNFWKTMESNDFTAAAECLSPDCEVLWPLTTEVIRGRANFAALNSAYPAKGVWTFDIERIVADGEQVVTDVVVSDGARKDRVITFHTVRDGLICKQVEYWPEEYAAANWRAKWVERH